jgi:hypothetical protein
MEQCVGVNEISMKTINKQLEITNPKVFIEVKFATIAE